jgi:hypothetical protein
MAGEIDRFVLHVQDKYAATMLTAMETINSTGEGDFVSWSSFCEEASPSVLERSRSSIIFVNNAI